MKRNIEIRKAERQDVPLLLEFIKGIARYEKMENEVIASGDVLEREMFDEHRAEAVFAVMDGREVGFALFFYNFSTFIGHSGLYLEDLFVWPEERTGAPLWTYGVVVSELEPAQHRLLPLPWSRTYEGMDGVSVRRYCFGTTE